MRKKALFFTHHTLAEKNPSGFRVDQYFPYLERRGFSVRAVTGRTALIPFIRACRESDVIYVQRLLLSPIKRYLVRKFARRIVFDFDDAIMYGRRGSTTRRNRFIGMVRSSDLVFCGNSFLLSEAKKYKTSNAVYVPTVVDTDQYPVKVHTKKEPFIAGWIGSSSTLTYLNDIEPLFSMCSPSVLFKVVADKAPDLPIRQLIFEEWKAETEKRCLIHFDMGLMPVRDDVWSRGKCGAKLIQYAAAGLPAVSHPRGVSNEVIVDGENGFLREDADGWRDSVERLRVDVDLRQRMGRRMRSMAEERYCLKVWGPRIAAMLDEL